MQVSKFEEFSLFMKEHDILIKKFNINFIFLKDMKIPIMCLYKIIDIMFKNNSKKLSTSDIILLTLFSLANLSKENSEHIKILSDELNSRHINEYNNVVKKTIMSIKNLSNIILKNDGLVIKNIEQFLKYRFSIKILNLIYSYVSIFDIKIKDFCNWFITDQVNKESKDIIKYININYF